MFQVDKRATVGPVHDNVEQVSVTQEIILIPSHAAFGYGFVTAIETLTKTCPNLS